MNAGNLNHPSVKYVPLTHSPDMFIKDNVLRHMWNISSGDLNGNISA